MSAMVKEIMTTDVIAVRSDTSFKDMASLLSTSRISALPVLDEAEHVIGARVADALTECLLAG